MTATPSSEARAEARAEAERRYPAPDLPGDNIGLRVGFVEGAEWKGAQVAGLIEAARALDDRFVNIKSTSALTLSDEFTDFIEAIRALSGVESSDEGEAQ
jgi:hypothetical protein